MIRLRHLALVLCAAPLVAAAAQARPATPPAPFDAEAVQSGQPYAIEVAPGVYRIYRPAPPRSDVRAMARRRTGRRVLHSTRIVHDKPVVIEHTRVVDDPPRVIERRHIVDDTPRAARASRTATAQRPVHNGGKPRVIRAEAEVTIYGPDRMNIRLFRKGTRGAPAMVD